MKKQNLEQVLTQAQEVRDKAQERRQKEVVRIATICLDKGVITAHEFLKICRSNDQLVF